MSSFSTFKGVLGAAGKILRVLLAGYVLTTVCTEAAEGSARVSYIRDFENASMVTIDAGYHFGIRKGMKLIAFDSQGAIAELIVLDVDKNRTETLITDLFGQNTLMLGNQVHIKTINFAATWK